MIIEIIHSRGLTINIDGQAPPNGDWSVGEDEEGLTCTESLTSDRGVLIGPHRVLGLRYDISMEDFMDGADPTTMTLITETGKIEAPVTQIRNGGPEEDEKLILESGKERWLDETMVYVRAELTDNNESVT